MPEPKSVYVCGPLTELPPSEQEGVKRFYERIGAVAEAVFGIAAFIPHHHYDPIKNGAATPQEIDAAERAQVSRSTSCLVVVTLAPSWGGGIEVEIANRSGVPVILLCENEKLEARQISRLLRGNPAVTTTISYRKEKDALQGLEREFRNMK